MRVLFILHYPPPVHGSAIVGGLIKNSLVIQNQFNCRFVNLSLSNSVDDIEKKNPRKIYRYLRILVTTFKYLILFRPDICYITPVSKGPGFYKDSLVIFIVKLFCRKVVYHFHNKGVVLRQQKILDDLLYRTVFKNAYVILLSKLLYPDIKKYVPQERIFYCSNGIPSINNQMKFGSGTNIENTGLTNIGIKISSSISGHLGRNAFAKNGNVELLFLSNLIKSKGILTLIEACKILQSKKLNFHCTVIGDNGDMTVKDVQKMVDMSGLNKVIKVTGAKYGQEKLHLMSAADIMVHPTQNDCLPLVLLEAMQHSLPIVSTHVGAIPDVVEDNVSGFLVQQNNPAALAEKLEQLIISRELRVKMGASGFIRYEKEYTQETFENNMVFILKQLRERK